MESEVLVNDQGHLATNRVMQPVETDDLLVMENDVAYCQPCVSPVWDTGLACLALLENGAEKNAKKLSDALGWMGELQLQDEPGDWRTDHPNLAGGGWAFQYENAYYPDLDDTAAVAWAMHLTSDRERYAEWIRRAAEWLRSVQHADGGWGETNDSYLGSERSCNGNRSTAFQTAWALLGLVAAGEGDSEAVRRGVDDLLSAQAAEGGWSDPEFTAPGFPRVFYLRYHGYSMFFPPWALARYRSHVNAR